MAGSTDGLYYHSVAGVHGRPRLASDAWSLAVVLLCGRLGLVPGTFRV